MAAMAEAASPEAASPEAVTLPDTTALYLARMLVAERGYTPGTVPEARALAEASDIILTKSDGMTFQMVCLIDRETHPEREFPLSLAAIVESAKGCAKYTGTVNGAQLPVGVQIWEVRSGASTPADVARIKQLSRRMAGKERVVVSGWLIDSNVGTVQTTVALNGLFSGRRYIERVLQAPRKAAEELAPAPPAAMNSGVETPWVTYTMLGIFALVFIAELLFGVAPWSGPLSPDVRTLLALGASSKSLVQDGEWYRLLTAAFLHGDIFHLAMNGIAFFMAGMVLEFLLGRAWMFALFVVGALGGSALSVLIHPPHVVSVGASGAIMAMLAAALIVSYRIPSVAERTQIQMQLAQILIPSLIPLATHRSGGEIDFAAHLGGALVGGAAGGILRVGWPRAEPVPRGQALAWLIALAGAAGVAYGAYGVARHYGEYALAVEADAQDKFLIPDEELHKLDEKARIDQADKLVEKYPRDPRARLFNAFRLSDAGDAKAAMAELRMGLKETNILKVSFENGKLELALRGFLAGLLIDDGKRDEARQAAAPVCKAGPNGSIPDSLKELAVCP